MSLTNGLRLVCVWLFAAWWWLALPANAAGLDDEERAWVDAQPKVKVGLVANNEPYTFFSEGKINGLSVDVLREIETHTGLRFDFRIGNWSEVYQAYLNGELDAVADMSHTPEREAFTLFTEPYHLRDTVLFENADRPLPAFERFSALQGQRIGVIRDIYYRDLLAGFGNVEIVEYHNYVDLIKSLAFGWTDGIVTGSLTGEYHARELNLPNLRIAGALDLAGLAFEDYRIGVRRDKPVLHRVLVKGLAGIPEQRLAAMSERWQLFRGKDRPLPQTLVLDDAERAFLRAHPVMKAAILQDYEPFSFEHDGKVSGYSVDLLGQISRRIGMRVEPVVGTWGQMLDAFRRGEVDVIANISHSDERERYTLFTRDYYRIPNVVFVRDGFGTYEGLKSLRGRKLAITRDVFYADRLAGALGHALVPFDAQDEMMKALSFGRVDAVVTALNTGNTHVRRQGLLNVEIAGELVLEGVGFEDLRFGIRPDLPLLHGLFEKAMAAIPVEETIALQNRWLSSRSHAPRYREVVLDAQERDYLEHKGVIRFCARPDWVPYEALEGGKHSGMAADLLALLAERGQVSFEAVATRDWAESLAAALRRECDLLPMAMPTARLSGSFDFSKPYLTVPGVVATAIDTPFFDRIEELGHGPLGVLAGNEYVETETLERGAPRLELVSVAEPLEGIRQVRDGELIGYVSAMANLSQQLQQHRISDIKIAGRLPEDWRFAIATRNDEPELGHIIGKLLDSVTTADLQRIQDRWLAMRIEQRFDYATLSKWLGAMLLFALGIVSWNRRLRVLNQKLAVANARLQELSVRDPLTGLHNRAWLAQRLSEIFNLCRRNRLPVAVAMIDIDRFKNLNDNHGHQAGDECLRHVARALEDHFQRSSDVVARYGGEEFTVVLSGLQAAQLHEHLDKLCERIRALAIPCNGSEVRLTVSAGGHAGVPDEYEDGEAFLALADQALYRAKELGRNRVVVWGESEGRSPA
ncbi:MAG: transporter substrate-binding domain-containing protein [Rhodocyclales bacterium]|nr:transporter substrate-binding domain-containing protein [Rhodocyclales bacterium]